MKRRVTIAALVLLLVFLAACSFIPVEKLILFLPSDKVIQSDDPSVSCRLINLSMKTVDYDGLCYVLEFYKDTEWVHCTLDPEIRFELWQGYLQPFHWNDFEFGLTYFDALQPGAYRIRKTMEYNNQEFYTYCYFSIV